MNTNGIDYNVKSIVYRSIHHQPRPYELTLTRTDYNAPQNTPGPIAKASLNPPTAPRLQPQNSVTAHPSTTSYEKNKSSKRRSKYQSIPVYLRGNIKNSKEMAWDEITIYGSKKHPSTDSRNKKRTKASALSKQSSKWVGWMDGRMDG